MNCNIAIPLSPGRESCAQAKASVNTVATPLQSRPPVLVAMSTRAPQAAPIVKRARLEQELEAANATATAADTAAAATIIIDSHAVQPKRASCGLLFDVIATGGTAIVVTAVHLTTWSRSPIRPMLRVYACAGSFAEALDDDGYSGEEVEEGEEEPLEVDQEEQRRRGRRRWQAVVRRPQALAQHPEFTRVALSRPVRLAPGERKGFYLHTSDNWGVPFVPLPPGRRHHYAGTDGEPGADAGDGGASSAADAHVRIGVARCAVSPHAFRNLALDTCVGESLFSGRLEYGLLLPEAATTGGAAAESAAAAVSAAVTSAPSASAEMEEQDVSTAAAAAAAAANGGGAAAAVDEQGGLPVKHPAREHLGPDDDTFNPFKRAR